MQKTMWVLILVLVVCLSCGEEGSDVYLDGPPVGSPGGYTIQLAWDANWESHLAGYRLYHSNVSGQYTKGDYLREFLAGIESCTIHHVPSGTHFWVLTAFDTSLNESDFSNEVSVELD